MLRKRIIIPAAALVAAGIISFGTMGVRADFSGRINQDQMIQKLAQKLGVDQTKVKSALEELQQENYQAMLKAMQDNLDRAVKDGGLTQEQSDAILSKKKEMKSKHESEKNNNKNQTIEQRRNARQQDRDELEAWAKNQGIDLKYYFGPKGGHMGKRGEMMEKEWLN